MKIRKIKKILKIMCAVIVIWHFDVLNHILQKLDDLFIGAIWAVITPDEPSQLQIKFLLYTPSEPKLPSSQGLLDIGATFINQTSFDCNQQTKIIIHGAKSVPTNSWIQKMKDKLLDHYGCNVIVVDWSVAASSSYFKSAANTPLVGKQIATFIDNIQKQTCATAGSFHLIGHSLGAHVAGFTGKCFENKLGRITGLDPAGPLFTKRSSESRLSSGDAEFVDVIHTNTGDLGSKTIGVGLLSFVGHVDFYPNGGHEQPGCDTDGWCHHRRAHVLFMATIGQNPESLIAFACPDYPTFLSEKCSTCGLEGESCAVMGILAKDFWIAGKTRTRVPYYIRTNSDPPYFTDK